jgi:outer membrane biosynthesis protein TonB
MQGGSVTPGSTGAEGDGGAHESQDAGPTTTTTVALGAAGNLEGSKLTSTSTQTLDGTSDGGTRGPHSIETGRGTKDIQAIVVARRDDARACYDAAIKAHPGIEGNLDIQWTIDPKGNVTDISVDTSHSDILEPTVGNCVIAIIKKIHFNESAKGFETKTHYPFNFHPRSGGVMVVKPDAGGH